MGWLVGCVWLVVVLDSELIESEFMEGFFNTSEFLFEHYAGGPICRALTHGFCCLPCFCQVLRCSLVYLFDRVHWCLSS